MPPHSASSGCTRPDPRIADGVRRVILLTEIPAPYRIPLFNALAERVDLEVVFLAQRSPGRPYDLHEKEMLFRRRVLPHREVTIGGRWLVLNHGVLDSLHGADAVVVGGWNQPAFWLALAWARATRTPAIGWVESTLRDRRGPSTDPAKRLAAATFSAFVVPGAAAREYVHALAPSARVEVAPNAVDAALFASRVGDRDALRSELGIGGCCFLYVGRLAPEKGVDVLLRAFEGVDGELVIVGDGSERDRLRSLAPPGTRFLGHLDRDALPAWYAAADALVLPSLSEPWGMPLNEAAAAGLPLIATDAVGAAHELIEDGRNGFVVKAGDVDALRGALERLAGDEALRHSAGERSRELVAQLTPERWADSVTALVESCR
jgi:glycosyltransferase involved in cell wall biosynthesis